jgi:putative peptide maturation dehydrogenase
MTKTECDRIMKLRRPGHVYVELRERAQFSLESLLQGGPGVSIRQEWVAWMPHLETGVAVDLRDMAVLADVPVDDGVDAEELAARHDAEQINRLLDSGALLGEHAEHATLRARDRALQRTSWWGPALLAHRFGRWRQIDVGVEERPHDERKLDSLLKEWGPPPPELHTVETTAPSQSLPSPRKTALDELLSRRATCRNFDPDFHLPLQDVGDLLHRVFGAQAVQQLAPEAVALKKNSPSGGGLHPIEAFLLVQRVAGLAPGLYHYQPVAHALAPMQRHDGDGIAALAKELVAGQRWFANAPILVLMAARFQRNFWKYRNHSKAWKVIQLDAGHLSQNLYLSATEQGYGAFVTGAINDDCAERLFGLDGLSTGAVAVCGFGRRAKTTVTTEFDPLGKAVR